jgi:hypothetical protein
MAYNSPIDRRLDFFKGAAGTKSGEFCANAKTGRGLSPLNHIRPAYMPRFSEHIYTFQRFPMDRTIVAAVLSSIHGPSRTFLGFCYQFSICQHCFTHGFQRWTLRAGLIHGRAVG